MNIRDLLLTLSVPVIWGLGFTFDKAGMAEVQPLLLMGMRFCIVAFALVYGLTRGAQSLLTSLAWADYFGRASQGGIRGISAPFRIVSGAGGPMLAGLLYDAYGSYTVAFTIFAALFWIGGIAMVLARPPQVTVVTPQAAA